MSEETIDKVETETGLSLEVRRACAIAAGKIEPVADDPGYSIRGGHKDLNCKGRGDWWFRMVYRDGAWTYFTEQRLSNGTFRASERRETVKGQVYFGEIIIEHDRGGPVNNVGLIVGRTKDGEWAGTDAKGPIEWLTMDAVTKHRDGTLTITLPDGGKVRVPNPRAR